MEQEVYGKEVAEIICIKTDWQDALDIRDDGVYVKDGYLAHDPGEQAFTWTPACEMDWSGAPDPLTAPSLPIPFTANDLAAFILDGAGHGIQGRYGRIEHGPDEDELRNLGIRGNKVRKVLREAYNLARRAQFSVGTDNIEEQQRAADLLSAYADSREEAMAREKVMERVIVGKHADGSAAYGDFIPREEYLRRLARVNEAVADKKEDAQNAKVESDSRHVAWRNAMVNQLLRPLSTQAAAAHVVDGAEETEPISPKFEQWRLLWRAVSFDENRVKTAMNELEHFTPTGISEVVIRDEKRTSLREEFTRIAVRKDWLALQMGVDMQLAAERRFTVEEMAESRQPPEPADVAKRGAEIALASQEIDALIAKCLVQATKTFVDQTVTVAQVPPETTQNVEHVPVVAIPLALTNVMQSEAAGDPEPAKPSWKLKTGRHRDRGYRLELLTFLKAEMLAGRPIPNASDLINAWVDKPPVDIVVIRNGALVNPPKSDRLEETQVPLVRTTRNGIRYKISTGEFRYSALKSINARIKSLTELSQLAQ